jgi:hypothetical protein
MRIAWFALSLLVAACSAAADDDPGTKPAGADIKEPPGQAATQSAEKTPAPSGAPASTQPAKLSSGDAQVDKILDRLEVKGEAIKGLSCKLVYKYVTVFPVEDAQIKEGNLLFARDAPNSKFLIHFEKLIADGVVIPRDEYFLFDGEWFVERNDKARTVIRRQVVRKGERIDPFKLGEGPFPLPFGQNRADILRNFKVTLVAFELGDPRNSHHLRCVPLPDSELASKYSRVDMFIDRRVELPVRIVTRRVADGNRIEVDFREIDADEAPAKSRFRIEVPAGFEVREEPLPPIPTEHPTGAAR